MAELVKNPNPREPATAGEDYLLQQLLQCKLFEGWTIFEQPIINSMHPDFVLTHEDKGIIIIEVKDWHLQPPQYMPNGQVLWADGHYHYDNPVDQVTHYKDQFLKYELKSFLEANNIHSQTAYGFISTVVYYHCANHSQALAFSNNPYPKKCMIWTKNDLEELCSVQKRDDSRFPSYLFYRFSNYRETIKTLVQELNSYLRPSVYQIGRENVITLTGEQKALATLKPNSIRRWSGVAGSGKTLILASKAAEALKAQQRVLIVTFNITLRHYIRDLCSQQFGKENRYLLKRNLTIVHFHDFLKTTGKELGVSINATENTDMTAYTTGYIENIKTKLNELEHTLPPHLEYDCILIDEGQDFNDEWIKLLQKFYTTNSEFFIVYDKDQSIYEDQGVWLTDPNQIKGIGFSGPPGFLKKSYRLSSNIVTQIEKLSPFFNNENEIIPKSEQVDLFTTIQWINKDPSIDTTNYVLNQIDYILCNTESTIDDITIITMHEKTGIELIKNLSRRFQNILHVYDLSGTKDVDSRRSEKWKFQPGTGQLKICSYHSFKGWENAHIILVTDTTTNVPLEALRKALYIALTRVSVNDDNLQQSFTCINQVPEFNHFIQYF